MKVKLRDVTKQQYKRWTKNNCKSKVKCEDCIFNKVKCWDWINYKTSYSDKFLDQEIEIDMNIKLTDRDKKALEFVKDVLDHDLILKTEDNKIFTYSKDGNFPITIDTWCVSGLLSDFECDFVYSIDELLQGNVTKNYSDRI